MYMSRNLMCTVSVAHLLLLNILNIIIYQIRYRLG